MFEEYRPADFRAVAAFANRQPEFDYLKAIIRAHAEGRVRGACGQLDFAVVRTNSVSAVTNSFIRVLLAPPQSTSSRPVLGSVRTR